MTLDDITCLGSAIPQKNAPLLATQGGEPKKYC